MVGKVSNSRPPGRTCAGDVVTPFLSLTSASCVVRRGLPQDACRPWGKGHISMTYWVIWRLRNDLERISRNKVRPRDSTKLVLKTCPNGEKSAHNTGGLDGLSANQVSHVRGWPGRMQPRQACTKGRPHTRIRCSRKWTKEAFRGVWLNWMYCLRRSGRVRFVNLISHWGRARSSRSTERQRS